MDVKIEERVVGHLTILNIIGRLTIDEAAQHLKNDIEDVIARGGRSVGRVVWIGQEGGWGDEAVERELAESRPPLHYSSRDRFRLL
jgi:hypothetical protein